MKYNDCLRMKKEQLMMIGLKYIEDMEKMAELLAETVKKKIEDPCGRLTPLMKYTTGEVRRT